MTERRRPGAAPVFWVSIALFGALFALLTYRFSVGQDPSMADAAPPRPAPVRKVIERRVVTTLTPSAAAPTPSPSTAASSPPSDVASAGVAPITTSAS